MKRALALTAALTLFAAGPTAPAKAAPAPSAGGLAGCLQTENGCIDLNTVSESTELYVGQDAGGSLRGFTEFSNFASWAGSNLGVQLELSGGRIQVDSDGRGDSGDGDGDSGDGHGDGDDGDMDSHHDDDWTDDGDGHGDDWSDDQSDSDDGDSDEWYEGDGGTFQRAGWSAGRKADLAIFYERFSGKGDSFALQKNETLDLRKFDNGRWDNRISSARLIGGAPGKGALLCAKQSCKQPNLVFAFNGGVTSFPGKFDNTASFVAVF